MPAGAPNAIPPSRSPSLRGPTHNNGALADDADVPPLQLSTSFDLDQNGTTESNALSKLTTGAMVGNTPSWNVEDTVINGTTGTFLFDWTAAKTDFSSRVGPHANQASPKDTIDYHWNWYGVQPVPSTDGQIIFRPQDNNKTWGGTYPAQRWVPPPMGAAKPMQGAGLSSEFDEGTGQVALVSIIMSASPSPGYQYIYQIGNGSGSSISYSWAGYTGTLSPGTSNTYTVTTSQLTGGEVAGSGSVNFDPGTASENDTVFIAPYWQM